MYFPLFHPSILGQPFWLSSPACCCCGCLTQRKNDNMTQDSSSLNSLLNCALSDLSHTQNLHQTSPTFLIKLSTFHIHIHCHLSHLSVFFKKAYEKDLKQIWLFNFRSLSNIFLMVNQAFCRCCCCKSNIYTRPGLLIGLVTCLTLLQSNPRKNWCQINKTGTLFQTWLQIDGKRK